MIFSEWLDGERGRPTLLAEHFKVSISAVSQWRVNGVPVDRMLGVRDFTSGAVTLDEMVSHTKPAPGSGASSPIGQAA